MLTHYKRRYPKIQFIEVENEPTDVRAYYPKYRLMYRAVAAVNALRLPGPRLQVGGPALDTFSPSRLGRFLDLYRADRYPRQAARLRELPPVPRHRRGARYVEQGQPRRWSAPSGRGFDVDAPRPRPAPAAGAGDRDRRVPRSAASRTAARASTPTCTSRRRGWRPSTTGTPTNATSSRSTGPSTIPRTTARTCSSTPRNGVPRPYFNAMLMAVDAASVMRYSRLPPTA